MRIVDNESNFDGEEGVVVLKFWAMWCAPCKKMSPIVDKMEEEFNNIKFYSVDVDNIPSVAQKYKIRTLPTLVLLKNGREINRVSGTVLTEPLRKIFKSVVDI